ncbi:DUF3667 domain-containing protein [Rubrivivax gelatinosus]|uniref:DUF3667 domain-containing protein n=1 Tax=Rubrivivax gelatinosus TaxID=28068 RepID=UPI001F5B344C|nr:DUF3667 domain-containing protein [Rubrivivax gelatinosus]
MSRTKRASPGGTRSCRYHHDRPPPETRILDSCPNCEQPLPEPTPKFCPHCGQETRVRAPTVGEFVQQFGGAYLSTEGAMGRTLAQLFRHPGELTRQYLRGRRKHYVLPLRLYLTISVLVLLALRLSNLLDAGQPQPAVQLDKDEPPKVELKIGGASVQFGFKPDGKGFECENLPAWVCKRLEQRLGTGPEALANDTRGLKARLVDAVGPAMFVLLPGFAAWLALAYRNRRLRYTEHLVFALHVHAFWFAMLGITLLPLGGFEGLAWLVVPVYTWLAMRRVYGGRWWTQALRSSVVATLYFTTMVAAMVIAALWALLA